MNTAFFRLYYAERRMPFLPLQSRKQCFRPVAAKAEGNSVQERALLFSVVDANFYGRTALVRNYAKLFDRPGLIQNVRNPAGKDERSCVKKNLTF